MVNSNNAYQYETSPRKLQPEYAPKKVHSNGNKNSNKANKKSINNKKIVTKKNTKHKVRAVCYLTIGFIILFTISYRNSLINESFNEKENLKQELNSVKKTNEQLQVGIENALNLKTIEQSAKERLGMQKPSNSQKVYVSIEKKDYIQTATEEVVLEKEESFIQKILNGLTKTIK